MPITPQQQKQLKQLLEQHDVAVAYLFGSQARGTARSTSDTDIALLFKTTQPMNQQFQPEGSIIQKLHKILGTEIDLVDLHVVTSPLLKHRAVIRGQLLYCTDHARRQRLERQVFHEYEDTEHLRSVQNQGLRRRIKEDLFGKLPG